MAETWQEAAQEVADEIVDLIASKQHDYGHDNINAFGEFGVLVRANDKLARLRNLISDVQRDGPANESIEDSWFDLAGYAIVALMLRNGSFELPLMPEGAEQVIDDEWVVDPELDPELDQIERPLDNGQSALDRERIACEAAWAARKERSATFWNDSHAAKKEADRVKENYEAWRQATLADNWRVDL